MKTISINAKCDDRCEIFVIDADGNPAFEHLGDAYAMPFIGRGDYIRFQIDVETGKIVGWDAAKAKEHIQSLIDENSEE